MTKPVGYSKINDINVLIVEDEIVLAMAIQLSLNQMGFNVSGIECTPSKAILHAQNNFPDIILMDINLNSTQTGIDAANIIWKKFKIPIVFLTSYTNDKTINKALECEPYGYLIKPCRDEELKATINTAMHKHRYFFKRKIDLEEKKTDFLQLEKNIKFDKTSSSLYIDEKLIKLTKNEKKLFDLLATSTNHTASFENIFAYIWREDIYDLGKLRTLIYRLKIKTKVNLFENIFEQGYKLRVLNFE